MDKNDAKTNEKTDPILKQKPYKTPERFNEQFHPRAIRILGSLGLNNSDIVNCLNISYPTFTKWIRTKETFSKALKEGRANRYEYALNEGYTYNEYQQLLSEACETIHDQDEEIKQLKNELNRYDNKPINTEHEKQMKYLDTILEKQKPLSKSKEPKINNGFTKDFIKTDMTIEQLGIFLLRESKDDKHLRWNEGKYYNWPDFFSSETEADRKARYEKGYFTAEEYSDMHPGW
jgi:hypothetical protein